jgi:hypothetical protein
MSIENLCNESPQVEDTSDENEAIASMPATNNFGLIYFR